MANAVSQIASDSRTGPEAQAVQSAYLSWRARRGPRAEQQLVEAFRAWQHSAGLTQSPEGSS